MKTKNTVFLLALFVFCSNVAVVLAQDNAVGKLDSWGLTKVASREKDDAILPVSYKMRVSKNADYDRIVFEFTENEVPEYSVCYTKAPITIDPSHLENPRKPERSEVIPVKGGAFVLINFALGFGGKDVGKMFAGPQDLSVVDDVETVDWFENSFTFAVGLRKRAPFRVLELSGPTRLVIDFKH